MRNRSKTELRENVPERIPWTLMDIGIGTILAACSFLGFYFLILSLPFDSTDRHIGFTMVCIAAGLEGVLLYIVWAMTVRKYQVGWYALGFKKPVGQHNIILVGLAILSSLTLTSVYVILVTQLSIEFLIPEIIPEKLRGEGLIRRFVMLCAIACWVPLVEEVFFRGFLFQGLAHRYGIILGSIISSMVFAVAHLDIGAIFPIFATGLMFTFLYTKTQSLWTPMAAHMGQNLFAFAFSN